MFRTLINEDGEVHTIGFLHQYGCGIIRIGKPRSTVAAGSIQPLLDEYIEKCPGASIDYIHGVEEVIELSEEENSIGFLLPGMQKAAFFKTVTENGSLPRKCFSLGEADEKRFYFECRRILYE